MKKMLFEVMPWLALIILSIGYWSQVWKTHVQKEVKDLSIISYIFLAIGFMIMGMRALYDGSTLFFTKQLVTLIPVAILIFQIKYHRDQELEEIKEQCKLCDEVLDTHWSYCPVCSSSVPQPSIAACVQSEVQISPRPVMQEMAYFKTLGHSKRLEFDA